MNKERPILFNAEMVQAVLDGRKTQTRRVMKVQPNHVDQDFHTIIETTGNQSKVGKHLWMVLDRNIPNSKYFLCPYGKVGDELWVRETWRIGGWDELLEITSILFKATPEICDVPHDMFADDRVVDSMNEWAGRAMDEIIAAGYTAEDDQPFNIPEGVWPVKWRPSIHMPRWASRIQLRIKDIRVERVQDISYSGLICEGLQLARGYAPQSQAYVHTALQRMWEELWDSINAKRGYGWAENPWVWVVEFEVIS